MHLHLTLDIEGNVLAGAAAGALVTAGFIAVFTFMGVVVGIMMSLGGSSGVFTAKYFRAVTIYVTTGAIIGGLTAVTGLPWWAAGLIVLALLVAFHKTAKYYGQKRRAKRGY